MAIEGVVWSERRSTSLAGTFCGSHVGYGFFKIVFRLCCFREGQAVRVRFCRGVDRDRDIPVGRLFFCKLQDIFVLTGDSASFCRYEGRQDRQKGKKCLCHLPTS